MANKQQQPKIWVRVVETHATKAWVAIILAFGASISLVLLVGAGMWNTISNPEVEDLSPNYASAISATLGVLVGSLATYVGQMGASTPKTGDPLRDDDITLDVEPPEPPPEQS